ncbi:hypothetical protein CLAIMM_01596 [Cladophialophora immunda]|nr:hypothetical protein CLAIMM_01596 [Cladophialophora immunda]
MFLKKPDLTAGSRPTLSPDEVLLFVQDGVGLYEGKYKIDSCQKGHAYLTSHRACYVDDADPRANSWAVDLKDVEKHEFQVAGFLKSSPKVTLFPKPPKRRFGSISRAGPSQSPSFQRVASSSTPSTRASSPFRSSAISPTPTPLVIGTWVCPICSFSNPVPSNFDPTIATESFPLPPCLACGIKPPFSLVLKAAIAANAKRIPETRPESINLTADSQTQSYGDEVSSESITCPRYSIPRKALEDSLGRSESPGPEISGLTLEEEHESPSVKFSFRNGGDRVFYERLKNAMIQRKWLLQNAPPIPRPDAERAPTPLGSTSPVPPSESRAVAVGIAGLEQRGLQTRKNNEAVLGNAFEDLEALMASAKDVVALAERFALESGSQTGVPSTSSDPLLSQSAAALGMVATKDMIGDNSTALYISELARNLAEYATDDRQGESEWRGASQPSDFHKAAEAWEKLGLPIKLRRFKSGLLVVQQRNASDEKTIGQIKAWLDSLRLSTAATSPEAWDRSVYGIGVTAQQAAAQFGWSLGVAAEELEMAEERGALCRDEGVEGLKFWLNYLIEDD